MQLFTPKRRLLTFLALVAVAAIILLYIYMSGEKTEEVYLFVVDARAHKESPLDDTKLAAEVNGSPTRTQVILRSFDPTQLIDAETAVDRANEVLQLLRPDPASTTSEEKGGFKKEVTPTSELFFIELKPPYRQTKMALRRRFDEQVRLTGSDRVWLLRRVVPVLRLGPEVSPNGCLEMKDDFIFMNQEFFGVGLLLDESAIRLLRSCKPF